MSHLRHKHHSKTNHNNLVWCKPCMADSVYVCCDNLLYIIFDINETSVQSQTLDNPSSSTTGFALASIMNTISGKWINQKKIHQNQSSCSNFLLHIRGTVWNTQANTFCITVLSLYCIQEADTTCSLNTTHVLCFLRWSIVKFIVSDQSLIHCSMNYRIDVSLLVIISILISGGKLFIFSEAINYIRLKILP